MLAAARSHRGKEVRKLRCHTRMESWLELLPPFQPIDERPGRWRQTSGSAGIEGLSEEVLLFPSLVDCACRGRVTPSRQTCEIQLHDIVSSSCLFITPAQHLDCAHCISARQWRSPPPRASIPAASRVPRLMGPMAMVRHKNGPGGQGFGCKRPSAAKPNRGSVQFAMLSSVAIISSRSSDGCSAGLSARPVATWGGSNWPHVSSCSARVLSHDPKRRTAGAL